MALPVTVIIPAYKAAGSSPALRHPASFRCLTSCLDRYAGDQAKAVCRSPLRDGTGAGRRSRLWIRLFAAGSAYLLPDLLATYVQEPGRISRTNLDRDCANTLRVMHRHAHLLGASRLKKQEAVVQRRWASGYLSRGQPRQALPHAVSRLRSQPYALEAWWITFKSAVLSLVSFFISGI